jgi:ribosomal-protein-alanine N-acetyltransferase
MQVRDLPEVLAIEQVSFPNPWLEVTFRAEIQNDDISFPLVAVDRQDKKIIGYIIYWRILREIQINNIAVHPDFRRSRIGEGMLCDVIEAARGEGMTFVSLEVRPSNLAARGLYEKLGFKFLGIRNNYYSQPPEDAIILGLDLEE